MLLLELPGLCIDKVRPDLCREYAKRKWCSTELKYMQHFCVETCEMCHHLGLGKGNFSIRFVFLKKTFFINSGQARNVVCSIHAQFPPVKPEQFTKVSAEERAKQKAERKEQQEELKKQIGKSFTSSTRWLYCYFQPLKLVIFLNLYI